MKIFFSTLVCSLFFLNAMAHNANLTITSKKWVISNKEVEGNFLMSKAGFIYIENNNGIVTSYPYSDFSKENRAEIQSIEMRIASINNKISVISNQTRTINKDQLISKWLFCFVLLISLLFVLNYFFSMTSKIKYVNLVLGVGLISLIYSFTNQAQSTSDPKILDNAFKPFKPNVYTRWNDSFFYVESKGLPTTHSMMGGITGWQQQVPIPQCYTGSNAWTIPLYPINATSPVPVNSAHFLRGAIALAVNGVAIFNPYTNTGVDALLDGQLDSFGGHCGRADDYHYHIAPLHLYNHTSYSNPIAFALDGYAVYGSKEPDGSAMSTLDANHGHVGSNGVYHYHGTSSAPYMIGNMVGKVTEDNTMQIIPQAAANPIRPAGAPLKGAVIQSCVPNSSNNGFTLNYTLNGNPLSWIYSWTSTGDYTFKYIYATGDSTKNYKAKSVCTIPVTIDSPNVISNFSAHFDFFQRDKFLNIINKDKSSIDKISIYDVNGRMVYNQINEVGSIDLSPFSKGIYFLQLSDYKFNWIKKIIIE